MEFTKASTDNTTKRSEPTNYLVFCLLGKVEHDREKLCFSEQWMRCYEILDDFLSDCGTKTIFSDQNFIKIKSIKDRKYPKTDISTAPTGRLMKWSEKNNRSICTKHLETCLKQIETAAQAGLPLQEWVVTQFPAMDTFICFYENEVLARLEKVGNLNRNGPNDFIFRLSGSADVMRGLPANQTLDIFLSERYAALKGSEAIEAFVRKIGQLARAIKIGATTMPIALWEDEQHVNPLIWKNYGDIFKADFKPNPAGHPWTLWDIR